MIDNLRKLPNLYQDAQPELVSIVRAQLTATTSAGEAPDGTAWAPLKKTGGKALANAAAALTVHAVGTAIVAVVSGINALQHYGTGRIPARPQLPKGSLPDTLAAAFKAGLVKRFQQTMSGR